MAENNEVYMEYVGSRVGSFSITGKVTKMRYRINKHKPLFTVNVADVPTFLEQKDFRLRSRMPNAPRSVTTVSGDRAAAEVVAQQVTDMFRGRPRAPQVADKGTEKMKLPRF